jgi:hypothetical protein
LRLISDLSVLLPFILTTWKRKTAKIYVSPFPYPASATPPVSDNDTGFL